MAASVAMMAPAATPLAHAIGGGTTQWDPVALPCTIPCSFVGDNTADGLPPFPVDASTNDHATWWTFQATDTTSHTVRATSVSPDGWWSTLVLTDLDGNVLAADDDPFGRDAVVTAALTADTWYLLALAGHDADAQGTALIDVATGTPDAPVDVTAAPRAGAALLAWTAPDDHGDAIAEYRVYVDGSTTYTAVPAPATSTTVAGLTIGTPVTFEVTAVNSAGESARSTSTAAVVPYGSTTTSVTFSPSTVTYPASFDVIATVDAPVTVNQGVVSFWRNGVKVTDVAVVNGQATLSSQAVNPGTYSYGAYFSGSSNFLASSRTDSIIVLKAAQVLTFPVIADTELAVGTFTVAPTSTGPVSITVVSTTASVCTVRNKVVTLVATGTCSLTAGQAGNSFYAAATPVVRAFTVLDTPPATTSTTTTTTTTTEPPTTSTTSTTTTTTEPPTTTTTVPPTTTSTTTTTTTEPPTTTTTVPPTTTSTTTTTTTTVPSTTSTSTTSTTTTTEPTSTSSTTTTIEPPSTTTSTTTTTSTSTTTTTVPSAPSTPPAFGAVEPRRLAAPTAALRPGQPLAVRVTGSAGPRSTDGLGAVTVTITLTPVSAGGHLVAFPCGTTPPLATVPFLAGRRLVVTTMVAVDPVSGRICVLVDRAAMVQVDLLGWSTVRGPVHAVRTTRLFDTRDGSGVRPLGSARVPAGRTVRVHVTGLPGRVPAAGVGSVVAQLVVVRPDGRGSVLAWSCGERPRVATGTFAAGGITTTLGVAPVDATTGDVCLVSSSAAHLVLDVVAWIGTDRGYTPTPTRLVDTRPGTVARSNVRGPVTPARPLTVPLTGLLPQGTTTAVVTVIVTAADGTGTVTLRSCDAATPVVSAPPTLTVPNWPSSATVLVAVAERSPRWCISTTARAVHVVIDLVGTAGTPPR